jgi:hypothetical protein
VKYFFAGTTWLRHTNASSPFELWGSPRAATRRTGGSKSHEFSEVLVSYDPVRGVRGQVSANRQWVAGEMATRILGRSRLAAWLNTQALGSNFSKTRMNLLLLGSNNAGSTSAPFAGKKIAKDAAPENSNRGFNELRCGVRGFATRPGGRSFISYQVYSEEGADNVI